MSQNELYLYSYIWMIMSYLFYAVEGFVFGTI